MVNDTHIQDDGEVLRFFDRYDNPPHFDDETGAAVENLAFIKSGDNWYHVRRKKEIKLQVLKEIDGKLYYFSYNLPINMKPKHKFVAL